MRHLLLACVLLGLAAVPLHAEDDAAAQAIFQKLVAASIAKDYQAFVADADATLKTALPEAKFQAASAQLAPQFQQEHETVLLGEVNKNHGEVYLFRLRFKNGTDDVLGILSLKDGKVVGILFQ